MATLRTVTLGCKVNQYETEYVRQGLAGIGYRDAADGEAADLCVVNTCTVTAEGDSKSRQTIRQLARRNPGTRIVVMGCYATRAPTKWPPCPPWPRSSSTSASCPICSAGSAWSTFRPASPVRRPQPGLRQSARRLPAPLQLLHHPAGASPRRQPPAEHVLDEIRRLVAAGYREIVLTGIHLGHYGVEWSRGRSKHDWTRLSHLLSQIMALEGDFRVRLSSIEATEVTRELIEVMAAHPQRICPHLHISMQSGSDPVLRRMKRRWGSRRYVDRCRLVRQSLDMPALTTDIIVGFPGESEDDFLATCQVAEEVGFSKIHIFPFSPRRGTPAADMADQVAPAGKGRAGRPAGRARSAASCPLFRPIGRPRACGCWSSRPPAAPAGWPEPLAAMRRSMSPLAAWDREPGRWPNGRSVEIAGATADHLEAVAR